ncbi:hypothetical protein [Actinoplanes sp. GCM10030250]|uniref:hypothetical protein n=1 Tax=Actinoplanes sp. GCM10030250 TaxID=3273376 RepID=UPI00360C6833
MTTRSRGPVLMPDEILDIAGGDNEMAKKLRDILIALADDGSEQMREMAQEVISGSSLREMGASSVYGDEVGAAFEEFWAKYRDMPQSERDEIVQKAREYLSH